MALATKNRRKIRINGRDFVWYISEDSDSPYFVLRVASQDKKFIVNYCLDQPDNKRFLIILGKEFNGELKAGSGHRRVRCPKWEEESIIKPSSVRNLVEWCLQEKSGLMEVDWRGIPIE